MKQKLVSIIIISPKESPIDIIIDQLSELFNEYVGDPILFNLDSEVSKTLSWKKKFSIDYDFSVLRHSFNSRVKDSEIIFTDLEIQNNTWRNVSILLNIIGVAVAVIALITGTVKT